MNRGLALAGIVTGLALAVLIGLGVWQWRRMGEKALLIDTITTRVSAAPVDLPPAAEWATLDLPANAYRPVRLSGRFDHAGEAHVFFSLSKPVGGQSGPGYLIITPFKLATGGTVLVNRGFVPQARRDPAQRAEGQTGGDITLTGLMRLPEQRQTFSGADDPARNIFYVRDPKTIAAAKGIGAVAPFMVDVTGTAPAGGLPQPGVTQIDIPNNHFQYALTWWSLAGALAAIFLLVIRQRPR